MTDSWTIRLPYTTPPLTSNQRLHWRAEYALKKALRDAVRVGLWREKVTPCESAHVVLVYVPRDKRGRDRDNLVATLKPCIDGLVDAGIVPDDTPDFVSWEPPVIAEPNPKDPHLRLEITRGKR